MEFWVIMDKGKKAIAVGSPRNRAMRLLSSLEKPTIRVMLYGTKSKADAGFKGVGFYDQTKGYLRDTYGDFRQYDDICVAVPVKLVFE